MGSNLSRATATNVHAGCGNKGGGTMQISRTPIWTRLIGVEEWLLVGGFGTFVEALDNAAELHGRYVRSCRTRCASEGERVL